MRYKKFKKTWNISHSRRICSVYHEFFVQEMYVGNFLWEKKIRNNVFFLQKCWDLSIFYGSWYPWKWTLCMFSDSCIKTLFQVENASLFNFPPLRVKIVHTKVCDYIEMHKAHFRIQMQKESKYWNHLRKMQCYDFISVTMCRIVENSTLTHSVHENAK